MYILYLTILNQKPSYLSLEKTKSMIGSITETEQSVFKATGNLSSACLDM